MGRFFNLKSETVVCDSCGSVVPDNGYTMILEPESNVEYVLCIACYNEAFGKTNTDGHNLSVEYKQNCTH